MYEFFLSASRSLSGGCGERTIKMVRDCALDFRLNSVKTCPWRIRKITRQSVSDTTRDSASANGMKRGLSALLLPNPAASLPARCARRCSLSSVGYITNIALRTLRHEETGFKVPNLFLRGPALRQNTALTSISETRGILPEGTKVNRNAQCLPCNESTKMTNCTSIEGQRLLSFADIRFCGDLGTH